MDHNHADQEWSRLEAYIDHMFGRYLRNSQDLLEYKPRQAIYLLETSRDDRKDYP